MKYLGNPPLTKTSYNSIEVVATEGQTVFNVEYNRNFLDVLVNGIELAKSDYTATDGSTVTLNDGVTAGHIVTFKVWRTFNVINAVTTEDVDQTVLGTKTYQDLRLLEDVNGDKLIKDSNGLTLATFDSEGKLNANNGLSYVGGQILVDNTSATFTNIDNGIEATNIGVGIEVGDVIQIIDSANNSGEFTIEVIDSNNKIIVNQAHAGGTTSKSLVDETATVTIKLLCKWYLAPAGLGQGWVNVSGVRASNVNYQNTTKRLIAVTGSVDAESSGGIFYIAYINSERLLKSEVTVPSETGNVGFFFTVNADDTYKVRSSTSLFNDWSELR